MRVIVLYLLVGITSISNSLFAQDTTLLELNNFLAIVRNYHPVAKQAELISKQGRFAVREAKGAFDPKLVSNYNTKFFENKEYYETWNSYVSIPTTINIDFKAGFERGAGLYLNPENTTPTTGLYYAGVSIPIGQGLLASSRNVQLKQSRIEQRNLENEANAVLNNLLLDATVMYYNWYGAYAKKLVANNNFEVIQQQYQGIREMALIGERAAIDTVEMLIQLQKWANESEKADMEFMNSELLINNFLWEQDFNIGKYTPSFKTDFSLESRSEYLQPLRMHPEIQEIENKISYLELERRLNMEMIKPKLNVNYNFILAEQSHLEEHQFLSNNYKAGFDFEFPLLIRKERAKLQQTSLKQQQSELKLQQKTRILENKVDQYYNKLITLNSLIRTQEEMLTNYETLVQAEQTKFNNGESSIFLVNNRLNKMVDARQKLIQLKIDYGNALGMLYWSSCQYINNNEE